MPTGMLVSTPMLNSEGVGEEIPLRDSKALVDSRGETVPSTFNNQAAKRLIRRSCLRHSLAEWVVEGGVGIVDLERVLICKCM